MKRTFFAIDIKTNKRLSDICNQFKNALSGEPIKWVNPDHFHITLFFLGKTKDEQIPSIINETEKVVSGSSSFDLTLKGCGVFPCISRPAVLWVGAEKNPVLEDLKLSLDKTLSDMGYVADNRPFKPHLTFGRIKEINNRQALNLYLEKFRNIPIGEVHISRLVFYESLLTPSGPVYYILKEFPMA